MNNLDILLPFGLPPPDTARDLIRECRAPALATLLARGALQRQAVDPFARALAHENWLAQRFGLVGSLPAADNSPPAAHAVMLALGLPASEGHWFLLHPTHIHIARDHLVLTDMRQLALDEAQARALFDAALPLFGEVGKTLLYGSADSWFMRADDWPQLRTATPDAASGRNVDIWMPQGEGDRAWRKLQNEIQMHWFTHPLNEQREALGRKPVNSLWLWGGADPSDLPAGDQAHAYDACFNLSGWMRAFESRAGAAQDESNIDAAQLIRHPGRRGLLLLDALAEPGLTNEWGYWLERIETLERDWFAPLLAALRNGELDSLRLILSGQERIAECSVSRNALRKFWIKPGLQRLAQ
ncbi:hypothetical protein D9O50_17275 [Oxalobacteraceae bacterium CAVE-383]|nr:hypothetical protein D9O50_17275 [Oxalobacteraceae bacterium CAVE-383]